MKKVLKSEYLHQLQELIEDEIGSLVVIEDDMRVWDLHERKKIGKVQVKTNEVQFTIK